MTRLVFLGGFLGAGKTTLLLRAASMLQGRGLQVGFVTNDQGRDLVDTARGASAKLPVAEVAGGCFCCRWSELAGVLETLADRGPDVILAEPVGSCTDLAATVLRPLLVQGPANLDLAPLSVLVSTNNASARRSAKVEWLQDQQVRECHWLLLGKADRLSPVDREARRTELAALYPGVSRILPVSGRTGEGVDDWLDLVLGRPVDDVEVLDIDYRTYAEAEAELGWLNAACELRSSQPHNPSQIAETVEGRMADRLAAEGVELAHFKLLVRTPTGARAGSRVSHAESWEWDSDSPLLPDSGGTELVVNLRALGAPDVLRDALVAALSNLQTEYDVRWYMTRCEAFRPLAPKPEIRIA